MWRKYTGSTESFLSEKNTKHPWNSTEQVLCSVKARLEADCNRTKYALSPPSPYYDEKERSVQRTPCYILGNEILQVRSSNSGLRVFESQTVKLTGAAFPDFSSHIRDYSCDFWKLMLLRLTHTSQNNYISCGDESEQVAFFSSAFCVSKINEG